MNILLINPKFPPSYWGQEYSSPITGFNYVFPPLGLATVAALSEPHHVEILDENVEKIDFDYASQFDIVGLTGYMIQSEREFEICDELRKRGAFVAIGGPNAYLIEEEAKQHCDVLIKGEAEATWPQFLKDYENNDWKDSYVEHEKVDMSLSPVPRFDLLKMNKYVGGIIQTTRGCPFTCDFCDIIVMYGRKVREKAVEQVIEEVDLLRRNGKSSIFFGDDNFVGNKRYAKKVLKALIEYNKKHQNSLSFYTQVSVNLAHDEELLELMYKARFQKVFIGIETPRKASLEGASKGQNLKNNLVDDINKIQSYNIIIMAGMIVGFDSDDELIFNEQIEFLHEAGIPVAMVGTLQAIPHTPLYERLMRENRLIETSTGDNFTATNIIPKLMTIQQLMDGYTRLTEQLYSIKNFKDRMLRNISSFKLTGIKAKSRDLTFNDIKILTKTMLFISVRWNHLKALIELIRVTLKKSPSHVSEVVGIFLSYVHMSNYIKKHKPKQEDIEKLKTKINEIKDKVSYIELPSIQLHQESMQNERA